MATFAQTTRFPPAFEGKNYIVLLDAALALLVWLALSVIFAPIVGTALRRMDVLENAHDVAVLRAKTHHPARHAA